MKNKNGLIIIIALSFLLFPVYLYFDWTDGNLEFVLSQLKGHEIKIPFWISSLIALLSNGLGLIFNIICWIWKL